MTEEEKLLDGLQRRDKYISSHFLYDAEGSRLFQQIMEMPEYYLYDAEYEILSEQGDQIRDMLPFEKPYSVVELGAGDGSKTVELLRYLTEDPHFRRYCPVDISAEATGTMTNRLNEELPDLEVEAMNGNYNLDMASFIPSDEGVLLLFLGSNIGNFSKEKMGALMKKFAQNLKQGDAMLIGFDLRKHPGLIRAAYDDPEGITRTFNLNLLTRFNREYGADFRPDQFDFYSYYHPETGEVRSYLVSLTHQIVHFPLSDQSVHLEQNELIHTEISKKFDACEISQLLTDSGFSLRHMWQDRNEYYADVLALRMDDEEDI